MAETDTKKQTTENVEKMQSLPMQVHAQYLKDCSFENPGVPESLKPGQDQPKTDISVNMDARKVEDTAIKDLYEVSLKVSATAKRGEKVVFLVEVEHGALVALTDIPEDKHHPLLLIEVPRLIFPFLRQSVATLTQDGGFPPLLLNPVDFAALYMKRFVEPQAQADDTNSTNGSGSGKAA